MPYIFMIIFLAHWATSETVQEKDTNQEIRCYCNLAECVETSYLCKSESLGCFSDLTSSTDFNKASHGCLELLPRERNHGCQNLPGAPKGLPQNTLLLCCKEDLCNHVDSPETRNKFNETIHAVAAVHANNDEAQMLKGPTSRRPGYSSHEVWFKAATIAVPICGALILLMLILLAVKILKTDPQTHPPKLRGKGGGSPNLLSVVAHNPSADTNMNPAVKKLPLLYRQNDCSMPEGEKPAPQEKNEANDKLNRSPDLIDFHLHKVSNRAPCNLYQPLLPPAGVDAAHYKQLYSKPLVWGWPNHQ
ncbi:BMP and activin membrane-bound inhibitor homolog [Cimex lectularius]|uniref:BMP and activin membrane-bound inhibitor homolog n=1 Tax=Cimex lectularius TaxID=79782 RepID=A0A8I6RXT9_CIMLE|nr:BMP and activin membrane-bound inhibitor homolog [Cimex lectularius]